MNENKPLIFITNDDGYLAKGVSVLAEMVKDMGEIVVFAPDLPRSGMSGAITASHALRAHIHKRDENITTYVCSGTPVDCVKLALNEFLDRKPDIILSGINHGSNAGISVLYSGTMGAAIEGCIFDIPSVGFSLCDHAADADFEETKKVVRTIVKKVLEKGLPKRICLNVNIPAGEVKGIKAATQTQGKWVSEYHRSKDGSGNDVYWLTGNFENWETDNEKTDEWLLANGYAAVVPVKIDATAYEFMEELDLIIKH
jgi:5'-nucleotidase